VRVTNRMLVDNFLANITNNLRHMERLEQQMATGRRISRPSDDPVGVVSSLRLRSNLMETAKYDENADEANSWLEASDTALGNVTLILQKARELAVRGATESMSQQSRDAVAKEVNQLLEQLVDMANSVHDGRYIFGGYQTTSAPFTAVGSPATAVIYSGDSGILNREIGVGITLSINVTGAQVFSGASNIFDSLIMLRDNLIAGNTAAISTGDINNLDRSIDNVLAYRAEIGAKINRLELHKERLGDMRVNFTKLLSANEDADMAEVIMNLQIQENVYRASLSTGARIIQPTLVDFLR